MRSAVFWALPRTPASPGWTSLVGQASQDDEDWAAKLPKIENCVEQGRIKGTDLATLAKCWLPWMLL